MSGIDSTTAGMDSIPLTGLNTFTAKGYRLGNPGWRGPQVALDDMLSDDELRRMQWAIIGQLETDRSTWWEHWKDIADYILPQRARFVVSDTNKGIKRQHKIRKPTATYTMRTLSAGMMTGMTSAARPWFEMEADDPSLNDHDEHKDYLEEVTECLRGLFLHSNLYTELPIVYEDLGGFGVSALAMVEDTEDCFRFFPFPVGTYCAGINERGVIDQFTRKAWLTPRQVVERFGLDNVSVRTKQLFKQGQAVYCIECWWYVGPNPNYDPGRVDSKFKRYISTWWEIGATGPRGADSTSKPLSNRGFDEFPVLVSRWKKTGEDAYGHSPGMEMLPDVKELQDWVKKRSRAADKCIDPPLAVPASMAGQKISLLAGDTNVIPQRGDKIEAVHTVQFNFEITQKIIEELTDSIKQAGYTDLFLMISQDEREQPATAKEIAERHEEKLLALGPVLNQINNDLLAPLVEKAYAYAQAAGKLPKPPAGLQGKTLRPKFVSVLHQAQKLAEIAAIERFTGYVVPMAETLQRPDIVDPVDFDTLIATYADRVGLPPKLLFSEKVIEQHRQARAKQQAQQQQMQQANQAADTANKLAGADTSGKNALTDITAGGVPGMAQIPGTAA